MTRRRPRVAIAVEPTILRHALTDMLREAGIDDVVDLQADKEPADENAFDAAVVTVFLPDDVAADVVIQLPDTSTGHGETQVRVAGRVARVSVHELGDLLRLLDDYCPGAAPRTGEAV